MLLQLYNVMQVVNMCSVAGSRTAMADMAAQGLPYSGLYMGYKMSKNALNMSMPFRLSRAFRDGTDKQECSRHELHPFNGGRHVGQMSITCCKKKTKLAAMVEKLYASTSHAHRNTLSLSVSLSLSLSLSPLSLSLSLCECVCVCV